MKLPDRKVTFGLIVGTRGFFNPRLAQEGRKQLLAKLDALGYSYVILPETATAYGAMETRADARKCAELFHTHRDRIDGVIVALPNFGDELGVVQTLDLAGLKVPVLVQPSPDRLDAVDVAGAVSMYALLLASGQTPGVLDWNNNYGDDEPDKCVCTHCSNFPRSFMGAPIEISELDLLGETLGKDKCFGAIKGHVAPGPMTYFRMSTDDRRGKIKSYLGEGEFTDNPFGMDGGIAVCKVGRLRELLGHLCQNGFEHHVAMARTHCAEVLQEAVSKYLSWDLYRHE